VLGDGKLGILCAWTLSTVLEDVTLVGHHQRKLERARWNRLKTTTELSELRPDADLVVEASGSATGLGQAVALCRPRGTLVLRSTVAEPVQVDLAPVVVKEIQLVGSRCGRFERSLEALARHDFPLHSLIDGRYPLERAPEALDHAARGGALKVLIQTT